MTFANVLNRAFRVNEHGSTVMKESYAGILLFVSMAYIIMVNPPLLAKAGMDLREAYSATCVIAIIGTLIIATFANHPGAVMPTMGLNSFFVYSIVSFSGYTWQQALAASFIAGVIYLALVSYRPIRETVYRAVTPDMCRIFIAGIGAFITFVGLREAGVVVADPQTIIGLADLTASTAISIIGIFLMMFLIFKNVKGGMLIGLIATIVMGLFAGVVSVPEQLASLPVAPPVGSFIDGLTHIPMELMFVDAIFSIVMISLFDSHGCILAVAESTGRNDEASVSKMTIGNAVSNVAGSVVGSSPSNIVAESMVASENGGRTGLCGVVVALLFAVALFFQPLFGTFSVSTVSPVIVAVGALMFLSLWKVEDWDIATKLSAFVCIMVMVLSSSISDGMGWALINYCILKALDGKAKDLSKETIAITLFFAAFFLIRGIVYFR